MSFKKRRMAEKAGKVGLPDGDRRVSRSRTIVKYRRSRLKVTDYQHRRKLISTNLRTIEFGKRIFVVRTSNNYVLCQVVKPTETGDLVIASASSEELRDKLGVNFGLKNTFATYATAYLCGRRYSEVIEEEAEKLNISTDFFTAYLDRGLRRPVKGAKIFTAVHAFHLGGGPIKYGMERIYGYDSKGNKFNETVFRDRVRGQDIAKYMKQMAENEYDKYEARFSQFIKNGVTHENLVEKYDEALKTLESADFDASRKKREVKTYTENKYMKDRTPKISTEERKRRRAEKLAKAMEDVENEVTEESEVSNEESKTDSESV